MFERLRHGRAEPVFLDSTAIISYFSLRDRHHDAASTFFRGVRDEELRARPLYTSEYVVDEVGTTLLSRVGHDRAAEAVEFLRRSVAIHVLHVDPDTYDQALDRFVEFDDQTASVTDHVIAVQAIDRNVECVLSFDGDFAVFGLTTLPE